MADLPDLQIEVTAEVVAEGGHGAGVRKTLLVLALCTGELAYELSFYLAMPRSRHGTRLYYRWAHARRLLSDIRFELDYIGIVSWARPSEYEWLQTQQPPRPVRYNAA